LSTEPCGGTHVARTGDIGLVKIRSESGVAAGVRRVEAASGEAALALIRSREALLREISTLLRGPAEEAAQKLERLLAQQRELEKRIAELQGKLAGGASRDVLADARRVDGITVLATRVEGLDDKGLREMADRLRDRIKSGVVVLGAAQGERALLLAAVTKDLVGRYHAGNIIKQLAPLVGGGGGGRPDFAQAGGKDPSRLDEALAAAYASWARSKSCLGRRRRRPDRAPLRRHAALPRAARPARRAREDPRAPHRHPHRRERLDADAERRPAGDRAREPRAPPALRAPRERLPDLPVGRRLRAADPLQRPQREA